MSADDAPSSLVFDPAKTYYLPTDQEEHKRLRLQHTIIKHATNGKILFPPFGPEEAYFVLDAGVGPGAWIFDVASILSPDSTLYGIDVSSRQFPAEKPANVSFFVGSVLALPEDWEKKFDIVHQRLLVGALKIPEWPIAIRELHRVTKPGGWIQLCEIEDRSAPLGYESAIARHKRAYRKFASARNVDLDIAQKLSDLLRDVDFMNVSVRIAQVPMGKSWGPIGVDGSCNLAGVFRAMKIPMVTGGGFGAVTSEEEYDKLVDDVVKEWDEIEGYTTTFIIVYAQRPTPQ